MGTFRKGDMCIIWGRKKFTETGKRMLEKALNNPEWFIEIDKKLEKASFDLVKASKKLQKKSFSKLSDKELEKVFSEHMKTHFRCHTLGMPITVLEWDHELLTNHLKSFLEKKIREKNLPFKVGATFSLLTTPHKESFQLKEEAEAIKIALMILSDKKAKKLFLEKETRKIIELLPLTSKKIDKEIELLYRNFLWLSFMYVGPALNKDYFVEQIKALIKGEKELYSIIDKTNARIKEVKQKQNKLFKDLSVDKKHCKLFRILRENVYLKGLRKDAMYLSFFSYEPLLKEIGKRLGLSLNQLRFMWPSEYKNAILKKNFDSKELNQRFKFSVYVCIKGKEQTLTGKKAGFYFNQVPNPKKFKVSELEGSTAVPGMVKGTVKLINFPEDMQKMNENDVLVSHATNPNLVSAMKKASAIITDIGGITCHAAIVSRELNIPCIIGTKIATKVLKDGDFVEVNANHGIIKVLRKAEDD
jgi:phosphohistidine swiveling domain-containing protein